MRRVRAWFVRLAGVLGTSRRAREFDEELASHLQLHIDDNVRAGLTVEEARRAAVLMLGGIQSTREAYRDRTTLTSLEHLAQDARFTARQLARSPGFSATAVLMLALGMGTSIAVFGVVDAALIRPLPYRDPHRLVHVTERVTLLQRANLSYLDYLDWKRLNTVFSSFDVWTGSGYMLRTPGGTDPVPGARVSSGFFRTLGVHPVLGRDFHAAEDQSGAPDAVILSYATWQKRFAGNPDVVGEPVTLDGAPHIVVGVLPQEFQFAPRGGAEMWTPLVGAGPCETRRSCHNLEGVARLKDGVSLEAATAEMTVIAQRLETLYPDSNRGQGASVSPLSEIIVGDVRPVLLVLLAGAGLLLVIACLNVASLLLVRSASQKREVAVRSALGATTTRLVCQFVTEGLVLVTAGAALALTLASWAMHLLARLVPSDMQRNMPYLAAVGLNARVITCAAVVALVAAVLFAIVPGLRLSTRGVREGLADGSRGSAGTTWHRIGSRLVVVELATAMVLLAGAGLLGKSLHTLLRVELGFQPEGLVTLDVALPASRYSTNERMVGLGRQVVATLESLPGIESADITSVAPVTFNGNTDWIRIVGRPYNGEHNEVNQRDVSPNYFVTLGATLLRGRYFTDGEDASKPRVAIVNRTLAAQYFPGENAVGKRIGDTSLSPDSIKEIVGVVEDIREGPLDAAIWPAVYYPFNQSPDSYFSVIVRTVQGEESVLPAVHAAIRRLDLDLGTIGGANMRSRINGSQTAYLRRSSSWLVGSFALIALVLGAVGLYGVVAYSVSQRTREIGVRMALGAERGSVYRLVLREAGWLAVVGIGTGLACAIGAATLMRNLLFGTPPWDVPTLAAVALLLAVTAFAASFIPARRAALVNPIEALRAE